MREACTKASWNLQHEQRTAPTALDSCAFQVLVKCSTLKFKHAETSQESNWIKSLMPARPAWVKNGQTLNKSIRCLSEQEGCP